DRWRWNARGDPAGDADLSGKAAQSSGLRDLRYGRGHQYRRNHRRGFRLGLLRTGDYGTGLPRAPAKSLWGSQSGVLAALSVRPPAALSVSVGAVHQGDVSTGAG